MKEFETLSSPFSPEQTETKQLTPRRHSSVIRLLLLVGCVICAIILTTQSWLEQAPATIKRSINCQKSANNCRSAVDQVLTANSSNYDGFNKKAPAKKFLYLAVPHTGSRTTRTALNFVCNYLQIECFTPASFCKRRLVCADADGCTPMYNDPRKFLQDPACRQQIATDIRMDRRFPGCCEPADKQFAMKLKNGSVAGINHHFPRSVSQMREYLDQHFDHDPDAFRFTIVRDPVQQFIGRAMHMHIPVLPLTKINLLKLSNGQSKFLGMQTDDRLNATIAYVRSLDFVGLLEDLTTSYKLISCLTGWPGEFFETENFEQMARKYKTPMYQTPTDNRSKKVAENKLSETQIETIRHSQWADTKLYQAAKEIFEDFKVRHADCLR